MLAEEPHASSEALVTALARPEARNCHVFRRWGPSEPVSVLLGSGGRKLIVASHMGRISAILLYSLIFKVRVPECLEVCKAGDIIRPVSICI